MLDQQVNDAIVGSAAGSQRSLDHVSQRSLDHVSQRSLDHVSERSGSGSKLSVSELRVFNLYYFLEKNHSCIGKNMPNEGGPIEIMYQESRLYWPDKAP